MRQELRRKSFTINVFLSNSTKKYENQLAGAKQIKKKKILQFVEKHFNEKQNDNLNIQHIKTVWQTR